MAIATLVRASRALKKKAPFSQVVEAFKTRKTFGAKRLAKHRVKKARKSQRTFNRKSNRLLKSLLISR